jgi:SagB-type dehydrogenase family enzyme
MSSTSWRLIAGPVQQDDSPWELFHENSKATPQDFFLPDAVADVYTQQMSESLGFEAYPEVRLPNAPHVPPVPLHQALLRRSLVRELETRDVTLEMAAALLRYAYGADDEPPVTARRHRTVYSSGSLFPVELFLHASRVAGLNSGIYHYHPPSNGLRFVREGDQSQKLARALMDGSVVHTAALTIFVAAMPERSVFRYGDRGYRFALLEAGAVVQNLNLIAGALGLACVNIAEYFDRQVDTILNLDGLTVSTLYVVAIGNAAGKRGILGRDKNENDEPIGGKIHG